MEMGKKPAGSSDESSCPRQLQPSVALRLSVMLRAAARPR